MTTTKRDILAAFNKTDLLEIARRCELDVDDDATPEDLRARIGPVVTVPKRVLFATLGKAEPRSAGRFFQLKGRGEVTKDDIVERMAPAECANLAKVLPTLSPDSLRDACGEIGLPMDGLTSAVFVERLLSAVMFSDEEREHLVNAFIDLTIPRIKERLKDKGVRATKKTKAGFRESLYGALEQAQVTYRDIVGWLDEVDPWRAQQVLLLRERPQGVGEWPDAAYVRAQLTGHEHEPCFNATIPVVLPARMTISSIEHSMERMRVIAYVRRRNRAKVPELTRSEVLDDGRRIVWTASHEFVVRAAIIFEWDFVTNTAMLRITQMSDGEKHENVGDAFRDAVRGWLPVIDEFPSLDLQPSIRALDRNEAAGGKDVRPYKMAYHSAGGRLAEGSTGSHQPFHGELSFDNAWEQFREGGIGRHGNFHWLANGADLSTDVHVFINAHPNANRVRFYVDLDEATIHYVLARIRHYCA